MEKSAPPPYAAENHPHPGYPPSQPQGYIPVPIQPQGYGPAPIQPQGYGPVPTQQQGYGPVPNQPQGNTVVVVAPVMPAFGVDSKQMACPYCHHQICSRVESKASSKTHLFALILCLFGCIPCCLIPYCTDSCQNREHYCPGCGAFLGEYSN